VLREFLVSHFDLDALEVLCFDLAIDYDMPHRTRIELADGLMEHCAWVSCATRHGPGRTRASGRVRAPDDTGGPEYRDADLTWRRGDHRCGRWSSHRPAERWRA
jgi:hypothetical protein